jgi:hypothetical protein
MRRPLAATLALLLAAASAPAAAPPATVRSLRVDPPSVLLDRPHARVQLVVTGVLGDGSLVDLTASSAVAADDDAFVRLSPNGVIQPRSDGRTTLTVRAGGRSVRVPVVIRDAQSGPAPSFRSEVAAVLSRSGCNSGSCHGAFAGKNGFRLSLFAHEADEDFVQITRESFGRRIDRVTPAQSLFLLKATSRAPHAGGKRLHEGSQGFDVVSRWLAAGAPADREDAATVEKIEVTPSEGTLSPDAHQQLRVVATYTDGRRADVTALATYVSQDEGVAVVTGDARVTALRPGDAFVVVCYVGHFGRTQIFVPKPGPTVDVSAGWKSSNFIDDHVIARLQKLNVSPAQLCDDAAFLRRVSLDLCGSLPEPKEVRDFLADRSAGKRAAKIEELLKRPEYAWWWATKLADLTGNDNRYFGNYGWKTAYGWWDWLRVRIERNEPYDEIVRNILVATSREGRTLGEYVKWLDEEKPRLEDRKRWDLRYRDRKTLDVFWAKSSNRAPEVVAQEVSHAFLGVRMDCAQCHKHPFDRWTQGDFWGFAAFFPRVMMGYQRDTLATVKKGERPGFKEVFFAGKGDLWLRVRHPRTKEVLSPRVLGGAVYPDRDDLDSREPLAKWITSADNPYFARSFVNRVWAHHLGRGLVEPTDAFSAANPPSHPELLDELAKAFVKSKFDLKQLHRTILNSRTYQLDWKGDAGPRSFGRYAVKRLPAESLIDAIDRATEAPRNGKDILVPPDTRAIAYPLSRPSGPIRYAFRVFGRPLRAEICDCERDNSPSLPQALYLLNDSEMLTKVRAPKGRLVRLLASTKKDADLIEELYLATLSRPPTRAESAATLRHLAKWYKGEPMQEARREAFEDVLWTLMTLKEFVTNH